MCGHCTDDSVSDFSGSKQQFVYFLQTQSSKKVKHLSNLKQDSRSADKLLQTTSCEKSFKKSSGCSVKLKITGQHVHRQGNTRFSGLFFKMTIS